MLTLLVEDDPDYAEIIAHTLKRDQHDVVTIDNVAGVALGKAVAQKVIAWAENDGSK